MRRWRRKPLTGDAVGAELLLGLSVCVSLGFLSIRLPLFLKHEITRHLRATTQKLIVTAIMNQRQPTLQQVHLEIPYDAQH